MHHDHEMASSEKRDAFGDIGDTYKEPDQLPTATEIHAKLLLPTFHAPALAVLHLPLIWSSCHVKCQLYDTGRAEITDVSTIL
jgi:hypothetical protein